MRQRQMEFYQGWDQEEAMKRKPPVDDEGDRGFQEEFEGDDAGAAEAEALQAEVQADEEEEEQSEPVSSTLAIICCLSLNIINKYPAGV